MVYVSPGPDDPIRQGDLFRCVPRIDVSLEEFGYIKEGEAFQASWMDLIQNGGIYNIEAVVSMRPVFAIVITQDCDAIRSPDIALCEIINFRDLELRTKKMKDKPDKWISIITQHARINQKWYYLPEDKDIGFDVKMGADFRSVIRVGRPDLEKMKKKFRIGRLNEVALAHFRERVAEFFRRYPYDEWYPLTKEELDAYKRSKPDPIEAYEWQK